MKMPSTRLVNLYIFLFCVCVLGIAYYMELGMLLEPCPLCITQRLFFAAAGIVALLAFLHNPANKGKMVYGFLSAAFALGGAGFAIRQIWLQGLPKDQIPSCGPSLSYMVQEFPFAEVLSVMLSGDGNCAEISWQDPILNMSIPQWSLVGFIMLTVLCCYQAFRK